MDHLHLWKQTLEHLALSLGSTNFRVYFLQTQIQSITQVDGIAVVLISIPNDYTRQVIQNRYQDTVEAVLSTLLNGPCVLNYDLVSSSSVPSSSVPMESEPNLPLTPSGTDPESNIDTGDIPLFSLQTQTTIREQHQGNLVKQAILSANLRKEYTFESFAVSPTNEVAYAGATAVAKNPGRVYNPLFLYGNVGVGKTHLMHAVGRRILEQAPQTKVLYCMGEQFTNEIIEAIQNKKTPEFRNRYRPTQALLIDDIQFIAGKNTVQEEFFHTFNAITSSGGQVILTSDRPPHEIRLLEDRLRSRFEEGLTIDIQQPNFELRTAILLIKAKQMKKELPMDVAQTIANHITSTRKLQGFLLNLYAKATQKHRVISIDLALETLKEQASDNTSPPPLVQKSYIRPQDIISAVTKHFSVTEAQLKGPNRSRPLVTPRQYAMYLLKKDMDMSFPAIGQMFGGRDHTTAMHSVSKIEREVALSEAMQMEFSTIRKVIYG